GVECLAGPLEWLLRTHHGSVLLRCCSLVGCGRLTPGRGGLSTLTDAGSLAAALAQVVGLRPPNPALGDDLDLRDGRRVQREGPLDADPEGHLAHGERLAQPPALTPYRDALEDLDPLPASLRDPHVHAQGVARTKVGHVLARARSFDEIGLVHTRMPAIPSGGVRLPMIAPGICAPAATARGDPAAAGGRVGFGASSLSMPR